jgi:Fe2+ transport system protein FeoA
MTLDTLNVGDVAMVTEILSGKELKRRLNSMGITKQSVIKIKAITLQKNTYEIEINRTMVALRKGEAQKIKVALCDR